MADESIYSCDEVGFLFVVVAGSYAAGRRYGSTRFERSADFLGGGVGAAVWTVGVFGVASSNRDE